MASNDDLTPGLIEEQRKRPSPDRAELLRRATMLEQNEAAAPVEEKPDPVRDAVRATLKPSEPTFLGETAKAVVGGVRDAGQEVLNFVDDSANWLNDNFLNLRTQSQQADYEKRGGVKNLSSLVTGKKYEYPVNLPAVPENETTVGKIGRTVSQFVVPFMGALKAASRSEMLVKAGMGVRGAVAGAATDAAAFDPHQHRLSNFILDITDHDPIIGESVFNYLASAPGDSNAEGRLKNVLEGLGIGAAAEMALRAVKLFKGTTIAAGKDPVAEISAHSTKQTEAKAAAEAAPNAEQVIKDYTDAQKGIFKDSAAPATADAARMAPALEASLKRPEVAGIAPREALPVVAKQTPRFAGKEIDSLVTSMKEGKTADVAKLLDESDFNLAKIDTGADVKNVVDAFSKTFEKQYDAAKHGVQSFSDIKELADRLGAGTKSLRELYGDTDNLAGRVFAHRTLLAASAEKVNNLIPLAMRGDAEGILALRKHVALHAAIQGQMKGVQTEVARALGQFRITASSVDLAINEKNALIEAMGGHKANIEFAQKLDFIKGNERLVNDIARRASMARTPDALFEAWVNGILSSPVTHATNAIGNSLVAIGSIAERMGAAGIGAARGLVFRDASAAIKGGEVKAYLYGMMEGLKDALHISAEGFRTMKDAAGQWRAGNPEEARRLIADSSDMGGAWKSFATDAPVLDNAAFGTRQYELQNAAITADNLPRLANLVGRSTVEYLGVAMRTPGRVLASTDELFKTVFYRGELKAQAYRKAAGEGLSGDAMFKRMADLIDEPTPELSGLALKAAREGTFTSPLGKSGNSLQAFIANTPGARYIMPFVRTPVNIMKYTFDRMPVLNLMQEQNRAILAAGGPQADMLISRWAMGGSVMALASYMSAQGLITGGGMEKARGAEQLGNVQAYSVKIGDKYYAYNRLDPLGMILGLAADFTKISGHLDDMEASKLATAAVLSISKNLVSKTYLSGVIDALDTFSQNSAGKWQRFANKQAGTLVPFTGLMNQVRKEVDPEVKEVWTMMDAIKSRIPGMSKDVLPHVNLLGDDVHYEGGLGPDIASPIATMTENAEPGAKEVARLNVDLKHPLRQIGAGDGAPGVELNPKQYHRLMKILGKEAAGQGFKKALNDMVGSDFYKNLPEDLTQTLYKQGKEKAIRLMYEGMKQAATSQLIIEDKDLRERFMQNKRNTRDAILGLPVKPVN